MIAPCLIIPSVCPVLVCSSEALVIWTGAAMLDNIGGNFVSKLEIDARNWEMLLRPRVQYSKLW